MSHPLALTLSYVGWTCVHSWHGSMAECMWYARLLQHLLVTRFDELHA